MIIRNRLVEAKLIKQLSLALIALPQHRPSPLQSGGNGITLAGSLQPPFATLSAQSGRFEIMEVRYGSRADVSHGPNCAEIEVQALATICYFVAFCSPQLRRKSSMEPEQSQIRLVAEPALSKRPALPSSVFPQIQFAGLADDKRPSRFRKLRG